MATICRKCGAFGCLHDLDKECDRKGIDRPPKEEFFGRGCNSNDNITGDWNNPYCKKEKHLPDKPIPPDYRLHYINKTS